MELETIKLIKKHFNPKSMRNYSDADFWSKLEDELRVTIIMDNAKIECMTDDERNELQKEMNLSRIVNEKEHDAFCEWIRAKTGKMEVTIISSLIKQFKTEVK